MVVVVVEVSCEGMPLGSKVKSSSWTWNSGSAKALDIHVTAD